MWKNKIKTLLLMTTLAAMMMLLGSMVGGTEGLTIAFVMALLMNGIMYFFSDRIVLSLYQAKRLDVRQYPEIDRMVTELARDMQIPKPKLWIITTSVANAFATGRNPTHSSVAFTTKIIELLEPHELRGVIAHELSHIYNRDILVTTIAATMAAVIGYMCNFIQHIIFYRSATGNSRNRNQGSSGSLVALVISAILMPIVALLIRLGISRSREYLADECGARVCHDPLALADALKKLHGATEHNSFASDDAVAQATSSLFIINPFRAQSIMELFSTHPPVEKRVALLQRMHTEQFHRRY